MRKRIVLIIGLIAFIFALGAAISYFLNRHYDSVEARQRSIRNKIEAIEEGMDEKAVLHVLGRPDSRESIGSDSLADDIKAKYKRLIRYRYDVYLGDMPFSVEGSSRASIDVYFDEKTNKVVVVNWLIF